MRFFRMRVNVSSGPVLPFLNVTQQQCSANDHHCNAMVTPLTGPDPGTGKQDREKGYVKTHSFRRCSAHFYRLHSWRYGHADVSAR